MIWASVSSWSCFCYHRTLQKETVIPKERQARRQALKSNLVFDWEEFCCCCCCCCCLVARLCPTLLAPSPWTVALQVPLPWNSPGKNIGVGCHCLLQGILLSQGLILSILHGQVNSLLLSPQESTPFLLFFFLFSKRPESMLTFKMHGISCCYCSILSLQHENRYGQHI